MDFDERLSREIERLETRSGVLWVAIVSIGVFLFLEVMPRMLTRSPDFRLLFSVTGSGSFAYLILRTPLDNLLWTLHPPRLVSSSPRVKWVRERITSREPSIFQGTRGLELTAHVAAAMALLVWTPWDEPQSAALVVVVALLFAAVPLRRLPRVRAWIHARGWESASRWLSLGLVFAVGPMMAIFVLVLLAGSLAWGTDVLHPYLWVAAAIAMSYALSHLALALLGDPSRQLLSQLSFLRTHGEVDEETGKDLWVAIDVLREGEDWSFRSLGEIRKALDAVQSSGRS